MTFKNEGEIKLPLDKQRLREFITTCPVRNAKDFLKVEMKGH